MKANLTFNLKDTSWPDMAAALVAALDGDLTVALAADADVEVLPDTSKLIEESK